MTEPTSPDSAMLLQQLDHVQEREARHRLKVAQDFLIQRTQLEAHRARVEELIAEVARQASAAQELRDQLAKAAERQQAMTRDLEHFTAARAIAEDERDSLRRRLAQLRESLSWRLTTPVRALQRRFQATSQVPPSAPQPPCGAFKYFLRTSPFRIYRQSRATLQGWAFPSNGQTVTAIRAKVDAAEFAGRCGLPEPEVVSAYGPLPNNPAPGFEVEFATSPGRHLLVLEAQLEHRDWQVILSTPIWCEPGPAET